MEIFGGVPFIVENGGAVYLPSKFFSFSIEEEVPHSQISNNGLFTKIEFGRPYREVRTALYTTAKNVGVKVTGIGDMSDEEFARDSGLTLEAGCLATKREYQEGFKIGVDRKKLKEASVALEKEINEMGFFMSRGGRYFQIMGSPAKVQAVQTLISLYKKTVSKHLHRRDR